MYNKEKKHMSKKIYYTFKISINNIYIMFIYSIIKLMKHIEITICILN